jgi:hypothetical protein
LQWCKSVFFDKKGIIKSVTRVVELVDTSRYKSGFAAV